MVLQEGHIKERAEITSKEAVRIRCVIIGILPYAKITYLNRDANSSKKCVFRHTEVGSQPDKKPNKSGGKGSVALLKNSKQLGCALQDFELPKSRLILRNSQNSWDQIAACASQKAHFTPFKFGKERVNPKE